MAVTTRHSHSIRLSENTTGSMDTTASRRTRFRRARLRICDQAATRKGTSRA